jgi:ferritin-like metal-binding protein YciE
MQIQNLEQLFQHELEDLYDAEKRIHQAMERFINAANSPELTQRLRERRRTIEAHIEHLEHAFEAAGLQPNRDTCEATVGLIQEANDLIEANTPSDVLDAGLIASIQRIEHYKIAGYGTARTYSRLLGYEGATTWLETMLDSAGDFDAELTDMAQSFNIEALASG